MCQPSEPIVSPCGGLTRCSATVRFPELPHCCHSFPHVPLCCCACASLPRCAVPAPYPAARCRLHASFKLTTHSRAVVTVVIHRCSKARASVGYECGSAAHFVGAGGAAGSAARAAAAAVPHMHARLCLLQSTVLSWLVALRPNGSGRHSRVYLASGHSDRGAPAGPLCRDALQPSFLPCWHLRRREGCRHRRRCRRTAAAAAHPAGALAGH